MKKVFPLLFIAMALFLVACSPAQTERIEIDERLVDFLHISPEVKSQLAGAVQTVDLALQHNDTKIHLRQVLGNEEALYILFDIRFPGTDPPLLSLEEIAFYVEGADGSRRQVRRDDWTGGALPASEQSSLSYVIGTVFERPLPEDAIVTLKIDLAAAGIYEFSWPLLLHAPRIEFYTPPPEDDRAIRQLPIDTNSVRRLSLTAFHLSVDLFPLYADIYDAALPTAFFSPARITVDNGDVLELWGHTTVEQISSYRIVFFRGQFSELLDLNRVTGIQFGDVHLPLS